MFLAMLAAWGSTKFGQCGDDDGGSGFNSPKVPIDSMPITRCAAGADFSLLVSRHGHVLSHGRGLEGQLGHGTRKNMESVPKIIEHLSSVRIVDVSAGAAHSVALTNKGDVYMWGLMFKDDDGEDECDASITVDDAKAVSRGEIHGMADSMPREARVLRIIQRSEAEYLGSGSVGGRSTAGQRVMRVRRQIMTRPRCMSSLKSVVVSQIVCGHAHTLAVSECGIIYAQGYNDRGQLGLGHRNNAMKFTPVTSLSDCVVMVAAGQQHSVAIVGSSMEVYTWGSNTLGQLGLGHDIQGAGETHQGTTPRWGA